MSINLLHENKLEIIKIKEIIMKYGSNSDFSHCHYIMDIMEIMTLHNGF